MKIAKFQQDKKKIEELKILQPHRRDKWITYHGWQRKKSTLVNILTQ